MALTGSPLQNNLVEYYTMVDFVREGILGTVEQFKNYFEAPILAGMLKDSSPYDVKVGQSLMFLTPLWYYCCPAIPSTHLFRLRPVYLVGVLFVLVQMSPLSLSLSLRYRIR